MCVSQQFFKLRDEDPDRFVFVFQNQVIYRGSRCFVHIGPVPGDNPQLLALFSIYFKAFPPRIWGMRKLTILHNLVLSLNPHLAPGSS